MDLHFYHCTICGKIIAVLSDTAVPTECCSQTMEELIPNRTDGAHEKHVPVFSVIGGNVLVQVGSTLHPMTESHSITWIGLQTAHGFQFRELQPGNSPQVTFFIHPKDKVERVYAFCNLHGLWCADKGN